MGRAHFGLNLENSEKQPLKPRNLNVQAIIDGASRGDPPCRNIYVCFAGYLISLLTAYLVQILAVMEHLQILDFVRFEHLCVFGNGRCLAATRSIRSREPSL